MNIRSTLLSMISAVIGTVTDTVGDVIVELPVHDFINTVLERGAWTVAILAGIVSIVNGIRKWNFKRWSK